MKRSGVGQSWPAPVRTAVVAVGFVLGGLFTVGSIIAARFEFQHFPPRPGQPRPLYIAALVAATVVSAGGPFVLLRLLLPDAGRMALPAGVAALAVALSLFGLATR